MTLWTSMFIIRTCDSEFNPFTVFVQLKRLIYIDLRKSHSERVEISCEVDWVDVIIIAF